MQKTYLKQLDRLRAFAVLFTIITYFTLSREHLLGLVPWGQMSVRLFVVLSGVSLAWILLRTRMEENVGKSTERGRFMHSVVAPQESRVREQQRTRSLGNTSDIVNASTLFLVVLASAWIFYAPLRDPTRIMPFVEDDFYYYLKVAQNVAAGLGSTFNGITRTNGYHPLYFVVLVVICKFAASLVGIFRGLWLVWIAATAATFVSARKLLERPGTGPFLSNALAVVFLIPCVHIFCQGMEVTLTLPLGLGLMVAFRSQPAHWTFARSVAIGLLAALTVLSRLDAVLLVLLLLLFTLAEPEQRRGLGVRQLGGFTLGGGPLLLAYFVFNRLYFHTWMPISGSAKQLKSNPWPTLTAIASGGLNTKFLAVFLVYAVIAFWLVCKRLTPGERPVLAAAVAFPYLQMGVLSFVSDWPLWGWYYYTLRFALLAGLVLLVALPGSARVSRQPVWIKAAAYGLALLLLLRVHYKKEPQMDEIYDAALQMQAFERSHPGVYAMGGGAGMTGYLFSDPMVQTEGLMMDPGYLMHVRHQDDLMATLRAYGVRYYIVSEGLGPSNFDKQRDGKCFLAEEPYETGRAALHLRSTLCGPPVADIALKGVVYHIYDPNQP
jgi:hypothetical protein